MSTKRLDKDSPGYLQRATDSASLSMRLAVNAANSRRDFASWIMHHLDVRDGMDVLDIGSGEGAQAAAASRLLASSGSLTCLDLSAESIERLRAKVAHPERTTTLVANMDDISKALPPRQQYDLAYSVYALYYAADPLHVLQTMFGSLRSGGRLAIACPTAPNGMVEIIRRFHPIPEEIDQTFSFVARIVEPFFRDHFDVFSLHRLRNRQSITSADDFLSSYRSTTYFRPDCLETVSRFAENEATERNGISFDKNTALIVGEKD